VRLPIFFFVLAGCAATGTTSAESDLALELADRVPGEPENCVSTSPSDGLVIGDSRTVTYRDGRTLWVNRLSSACPGLRPMATLIVESYGGGQICKGDRIRALDPGGTIPGPYCMLGEFVPYHEPDSDDR
jgi:hypothetical protein